MMMMVVLVVVVSGETLISFMKIIDWETSSTLSLSLSFLVVRIIYLSYCCCCCCYFYYRKFFFRLLCPDDTRSIRGPQISSMNVYRTLERTPVIYEKRWNSLSSFLVQIRKWNPNDDIIDSQVINSYWLLMIKIILMILHRSVQWKTDRKNLIRSKLTALFQNDFSINFKIYETLRDFEKKVGFYDFFSSNLCQLWWSSYSDLLVFFWIKRS